jgi:hypothetical protein
VKESLLFCTSKTLLDRSSALLPSDGDGLIFICTPPAVIIEGRRCVGYFLLSDFSSATLASVAFRASP